MTYLLNVRRWAWIACFSSYMMSVGTPCSAQQVQTEHPNLLVDASARFVAAGMAQSLDYTQPLDDFILGATVTGQGHTTGTMDAELVADPHRAAVRLLVQGRTEMDTVARQRRVTVWGDGVTTFSAFKTLTFGQTGFSSGLASSSARSDNRPR